MRQSTRPPAVLVMFLGALALAAAMIACGGSASPTPLTPTVPTQTSLPSVDEMLSEKTMGSAGAPNTIIEYVSMFRPESRDFHLTGDGAQMKAALADTGRAQIKFRNLYVGAETLNSGMPVAAMLARCAGTAHFFDAVNVIFQRQPQWLAATNPDAAVQQVMLGFGMAQSVINSCLSNTALLNGLVQIHLTAEQSTYTMPDGTQRVGTSSAGAIFNVPAVVVNGVLFDGMADAQTKSAAFAPTFANIQPFLK